MMTRDGDTVTLTLTSDQYSAINLALGIATGWSAKENGAGSRSVRAWSRLADAVNEGNPDYTPYNVRPEADATTPGGGTYTCPKCGATSPNPDGVAQKYCEVCHEFEFLHAWR